MDVWEGVAKIMKGKKGRNGDFFVKLAWLALQPLWVKFHWWVWNKI